MSNEEINQKLKTIIENYLPEETDAGTITKDAHLINNLNINSANLVDIVIDVEDEFDITIENVELEKMDTVGDALDIIMGKL